MGIYADHVLPRLVNAVMNTAGLRDQRDPVLAPLHGTVLELGFGSGLNLPHYPEAVDTVLAVDPATLGQRLARGRLEAANMNVEFVGLDGQAVDVPDASADCALVTWTLCTIPDAGRALDEVERILRPGGTLHFIEHGRAPDERTRQWQQRIQPVHNLWAGGCSLQKPIDEIVRGSRLQLESLDTFFMPGTPKWAGFTFRGVARKRANG